jgi:hypothetical protein
MSANNGNDGEQRLRKFIRDSFRPPQDEGLGWWLLQHGCIPVIAIIVTIIVAFIAGTYAIQVKQTSEAVPPTPTPPPEIQEFSVHPSEITVGEKVTIRWEVSGVKSVSIEPLARTFPSEGEIFHSPPETTEYRLFVVTADGEQIEGKVWQVIVNPPSPTPTSTSTSTSTPPDPQTPIVTTTITSTPIPSPTPTATSTPIPPGVTCISNDPGRTGWRLGERLPASGCSCLTGNWFCCPADGPNQQWRLLRGVVLPVGEAPTYPDFTNRPPAAAAAWGQRWARHNYRLNFFNVVAPISRIGLIVGQQPGPQNQCLPFGSIASIQVGVAPTPEPLPDLIVEDIGRPSVNCPGAASLTPPSDTIIQRGPEEPCVTEVSFTVANVGAGDAGPFNIRVVFDPPQPVIVNQPDDDGLGAGETQTFTITVPPEGNCFVGHCRVCITVDSEFDVTEANERNNRLCQTHGGG